MVLLLLLLELKSCASPLPLSQQDLVQNPTTIRVQNKSSTHFTMKLVGPFFRGAGLGEGGVGGQVRWWKLGCGRWGEGVELEGRLCGGKSRVSWWEKARM